MGGHWSSQYSADQGDNAAPLEQSAINEFVTNPIPEYFVLYWISRDLNICGWRKRNQFKARNKNVNRFGNGTICKLTVLQKL